MSERSLFSRVYVRGGRPLVLWLHQQAWLRRRLLDKKDADLKKGLDHDVAWILAVAELTGDDELAKGSAALARRKMADGIALVDSVPVGRVVTRDRQVPGADGWLPARTYEPEGLARPSAGLVFIHGGGWVTGDLDTHDTLCRRFALLGRMRVVSVAPRLAPEHRFPAAALDSIAAFRFVAKNASDFGIDPGRLAIGGDSAGGNLSAVVGLETRSDEVKPALTVLIYPAVDATRSMPSHKELGQGYFLTKESMDWYLDQYVPDAASHTDPLVSPMLVPDLRGAPPALFSIAGFDPLRDEAERYAERLAEAGTKVEVLRAPSLPHGFALMNALCPAALRATEALVRKTAEMLGA